MSVRGFADQIRASVKPSPSTAVKGKVTSVNVGPPKTVTINGVKRRYLSSYAPASGDIVAVVGGVVVGKLA